MGFIEDLDNVNAEIPVPSFVIDRVRAESPGLQASDEKIVADCRAHVSGVVRFGHHVFNLSSPQVLADFGRARSDLQDPVKVGTMDVGSLLMSLVSVRLLALAAANTEKAKDEEGNVD